MFGTLQVLEKYKYKLVIVCKRIKSHSSFCCCARLKMSPCAGLHIFECNTRNILASSPQGVQEEGEAGD